MDPHIMQRKDQEFIDHVSVFFNIITFLFYMYVCTLFTKLDIAGTRVHATF